MHLCRLWVNAPTAVPASSRTSTRGSLLPSGWPHAAQNNVRLFSLRSDCRDRPRLVLATREHLPRLGSFAALGCVLGSFAVLDERVAHLGGHSSQRVALKALVPMLDYLFAP